MTTPPLIRRCNIMINLCWFGVLAFPIFQIWFWLFNPDKFSAGGIAQHLQTTDLSAVNNNQIMIALGLGLIGALLMSYALWRLSQMFQEFRLGNFFSEPTIKHLHTFALILLLSVVYRILSTGLLAATLSWHNPPGQRQLILNFGSQELSTLFIAGLLLTIAWGFREAHRIQRENEEFV